MTYKRKLFLRKDIYNPRAADDVFLGAMKENISFHMGNCQEYKEILDYLEFDAESLRSIDDLAKIPPLPASYLKNHTLLSVPYEKLAVRTATSGTDGRTAPGGVDYESAMYGLIMAFRIFRRHKLISLRPANYIILGKKPEKPEKPVKPEKPEKPIKPEKPEKQIKPAGRETPDLTEKPEAHTKPELTETPENMRRAGHTGHAGHAGWAAADLALAVAMLAAPAKRVAYAVADGDGEQRVDIGGIADALLAFAKEDRPVRIIGLSEIFKTLISELIKRNETLSLRHDSKVILSGGRDPRISGEAPKEGLFLLANRVLGVRHRNYKDYFGAAGHPIIYFSCVNHRFHVPVYSRAIIRDVNTLEPAPDGAPGLLNLITPLLSSESYGSVLTGDIAVMAGEGACGCGAASPYFTVVGRAGYGRQ